MRFSVWFPMFVVGVVMIMLLLVAGMFFFNKPHECENEMMCSLEEFCAIQLELDDCPGWADSFATGWPEDAAACAPFDPADYFYFMCVNAAVMEGQ
jgi:hypothetical protein